MMESEMGQGLTYAALGLTALGACGFLVWGVVRIVVSRLQQQSVVGNDLDTRLPLIIKEATGAWQGLVEMQKSIIDEERKEKLRAQDEREAITKQFIQYSTEQDSVHRQDIEKVRAENQASAERVHARLDECNARDSASSAKLSEAMRRLEQIEANERAHYQLYRVAQATPPQTIVTPVVMQQPVQPQQGPASGFLRSYGQSPAPSFID